MCGGVDGDGNGSAARGSRGGSGSGSGYYYITGGRATVARAPSIPRNGCWVKHGMRRCHGALSEKRWAGGASSCQTRGRGVSVKASQVKGAM